MITRQTAGKIQWCVGFEIMLPDALPQVLPGGCPDGLVRPKVYLELCPLQQKAPIIFNKYNSIAFVWLNRLSHHA